MTEPVRVKTHLEWGADREAQVGTIDQLDAIVDRLDVTARSRPFIVELVAESGASVAVGLGRPTTVVNYISESLEPPYFQSLGDHEEEPPVYFYRETWSEFPPESAVPIDVGREALRQFFHTGARPENVIWQEV